MPDDVDDARRTPSAGEARIDAATLTRAVERMFVAAGCDGREARQVADGLVEANLYGHDSHGVGLVPRYLENLEQGLVRPGRTARVVADHGAIVGLDGDKGFGQAIGEQAMRIAIERARAHGLAMVGLANTHHLARIGRWGEQCAAAGFASVHFVNVLSQPLVAPWGGLDARLATNPFCVAVPHAPHPLVLDYATSAVAYGKARVALDAGQKMADGLLLDAQGRPTDDPAVMFQDPIGALLPLGGHKGFALAVMCELLGGALSGGKVQDHAPKPNPMINNMLSLVFAPDKLCGRDEFARQVERLAAWLRASPPAPASAGIHLPGEPERIAARERERLGIPLPRRTRDALQACAARLHVPDVDFVASCAGGRRGMSETPVTHGEPGRSDFGRGGRMLLLVTKYVAIAGGLVFVALVAMSLVSIVGRKLFALPVPGDVEMLQMCAAFASSAFFAYCHLVGGDVKVDFFTHNLAPRKVALLDAFGSLLVGLFGTLIAWRTAVGALAVQEVGETSAVLGCADLDRAGADGARLPAARGCRLLPLRASPA